MYIYLFTGKIHPERVNFFIGEELPFILKHLRSEFNLQEGDFNEIQKFALPNRHGDYPTIIYQERERIMNFTRGIIEKLIDKLSTII